jgi:putative aldouronate transport system substrate-binding protein
MFGPNGSGGSQTLGYIVNAFVYYDDDYHMNATDGQIWAPFVTEEYREALKLMNQWTKEGLISEQTYLKLDSVEIKPLTTPEDNVAVVGVWAGHPSVYGTDENMTFLEYEWLPFVDKENAETDKGGWFVWRPGALLPSTMITADCENVELAVKFCDFFFSDVASTSMRHGIQGKNWDYIDPTVSRDVKNVKVLDDGQAFFNGVDTWGGNTHAIMTNRNYLNGAAPATEFKAHNNHMAELCLADADKQAWPEEVVTDVTFNAEEMEYITQTKVLINDYIDEGLAKFGTGVWDPNNDADWNTYLAELESIGLSKYVETYQAAYTRMKEAAK